jgi:Trk-type K+ transport system membrane component
MLGVVFLPLIALGGLQYILALVLLAPIPIARPVLRLSRNLQTPVGWTVIVTTSAILLVFLVSSLVEIGEVHRRDAGEADTLHRRCAH